MKIVFVNFYSGLNNRGAETFVHELANYLAKNHTVHVFQAGKAHPDSNYQTEVIASNYSPRWTSSGQISFLRRLFLTLAKISEALFTLKSVPKIKKLKPDIIIPLNSGWQVLILSVLARRIGAKLVIAGQSGPGWDDRWNLFVFPHLFVSLTKAGEKWANKASFWKTRVVTIPNGVNLNNFKATGDAPYKNKLDRPIVLCVGALERPKRIYEIIKAISLTNASLLLVGDGAERDGVDRLGKEVLGPERFLHLSVPFKQMPGVYRSANLFTLCSQSTEAFGIAYVEAMASGLGCVATKDASRQEIIGAAGLFVEDPENSREYAKTINQALKRNFKQLALAQAQKYSWEEIALEYEKQFLHINASKK